MFFPTMSAPFPADAALLAERADRIQAALTTLLCDAAGTLRVEWCVRTGSTNVDGLRWLRTRPAGACHLLRGTLHQDRGRGRAGRSWSNDAGAQLMMSLATVQRLPCAVLPALSLIAGVAACEAIEPLIAPTRRHRLMVKWPNDLLWDEAKLAGILLESISEAGGALADTGDAPVGIVLGVGLNLEGGAELSRRLERPVADWSQVSAAAFEEGDTVLIELAQRITRAWLGAFSALRREGLAPFLERIARRDALRGRMVTVSAGTDVELQGVADGIDASGCLRVRLADATTRLISVGDVQVRLRDDAS